MIDYVLMPYWRCSYCKRENDRVDQIYSVDVTWKGIIENNNKCY
jgi:hypothetical protein